MSIVLLRLFILRIVILKYTLQLLKSCFDTTHLLKLYEYSSCVTIVLLKFSILHIVNTKVNSTVT